jgi:hypothetical protein
MAPPMPFLYTSRPPTTMPARTKRPPDASPPSPSGPAIKRRSLDLAPTPEARPPAWLLQALAPHDAAIVTAAWCACGEGGEREGGLRIVHGHARRPAGAARRSPAQTTSAAI